MSASTSATRSGGLLSDEQVRPVSNRVPQAIIDRFVALKDLAGTVADAMDELGITGVIGASTLAPNLVGRRSVGNAVTLRNVPQNTDPHLALTSDQYLMAELEALNQAQAGDMLVVQGVPEVSNMGGIVATICLRQGLAGAIVDGGIRDIQVSRSLGFPIWTRHITPLTGKWRVITAEVNGMITVAGMTVSAGDLAVADETGICFVPHGRVEEVLHRCEEIDKKEAGWVDGIGQGLTIPDVMARIYKNLPYKQK